KPTPTPLSVITAAGYVSTTPSASTVVSDLEITNPIPVIDEALIASTRVAVAAAGTKVSSLDSAQAAALTTPLAVPMSQPAESVTLEQLTPVPVVKPPASVMTSTATTAPSHQDETMSILDSLLDGAVASKKSSGRLTTDAALDIDDSEETSYREEEERKSILDGPLFYVILALIVILQVVVIGWLVNIGAIDLSFIQEFFKNLRN
ncbi:MAG: hypothetical protein FWF91_04990, partial [Coriobacteriia bacterium]|nr:hypothetical protein [Coriobacteriia bacterium]